jgi:hypothetical protein
MPNQTSADAHDAANILRVTVGLLRTSGIADTTIIAALAHTTGDAVNTCVCGTARSPVAMEAAKQLLRAAMA